MTDYNDGKWHRWNGEGMKPAGVHDKSWVEFIWHEDRSNKLGRERMLAGWNSLDERPSWSNVLKFRVVREHKEPREFWVDPDRCIAVTQYHSGFILVREVLE